MFVFLQIFQVPSVWTWIFLPWSRLSKDCCTCDQWHQHHQVTFWILCSTKNKDIWYISATIYRYDISFQTDIKDGNLPKLMNMKGFNFQLFDLTPILSGTKPHTTWLWEDLCFLSFLKQNLKTPMWMNNDGSSKKANENGAPQFPCSLGLPAVQCDAGHPRAVGRYLKRPAWKIGSKICNVQKSWCSPTVSQGKFQKCHRE